MVEDLTDVFILFIGLRIEVAAPEKLQAVPDQIKMVQHWFILLAGFEP